jgi:hypothetical protein
MTGFDFTEQFANMGENWVLEGTYGAYGYFGFATSDFSSYQGNELRNWMDLMMPKFLNKMGD